MSIISKKGVLATVLRWSRVEGYRRSHKRLFREAQRLYAAFTAAKERGALSEAIEIAQRHHELFEQINELHLDWERYAKAVNP